MYPGIGLGAILIHASKISMEMIAAGSGALGALAPALKNKDLALLPDISDVWGVSIDVAKAVIRKGIEQGHSRVTGIPTHDEAAFADWIEKQMWHPEYRPLVKVDVHAPAKI